MKRAKLLRGASYAYFRLSPEGTTLEAFERALGQAADKGWSEGELGPNGRRRDFTSWQVYSGLERGAPMDQQLDSLFEKLEGVWPHLADGSRAEDLPQLEIVHDEDAAARLRFRLSEAWVQVLGSSSGALEIDQYFPVGARWRYAGQMGRTRGVFFSFSSATAPGTRSNPEFRLVNGWEDSMQEASNWVADWLRGVDRSEQWVLSVTQRAGGRSDLGMKFESDFFGELARVGASISFDLGR